MPTTSEVSPDAFCTTSERYLPIPSCVMPRWTLTPARGTSANFTVLLGLLKWPRTGRARPCSCRYRTPRRTRCRVRDSPRGQHASVRAPSPSGMRLGSSALPEPAKRHSSRRPRWPPGPSRSDVRSSDSRSCAHLLTSFQFLCHPEHLVQTRPLAPDVVHVERAVHLAAFAASADHATEAEHPQVPRDARLAHMEVQRQLVDVDLAGLGQALQDAQARGVGKGQEMVGQLVARVLKKHKGCFMSQSKA